MVLISPPPHRTCLATYTTEPKWSAVSKQHEVMKTYGKKSNDDLIKDHASM